MATYPVVNTKTGEQKEVVMSVNDWDQWTEDNPNYAGLLRYCIKHNHWSVFEQSSMTLEIETTRAIAAQILRHRSFTFQEFSQRYAQSNELGKIELPDLRRQDKKNRQNSTDDLDPFVQQKLVKRKPGWNEVLDRVQKYPGAQKQKID